MPSPTHKLWCKQILSFSWMVKIDNGVIKQGQGIANFTIVQSYLRTCGPVVGILGCGLHPNVLNIVLNILCEFECDRIWRMKAAVKFKNDKHVCVIVYMMQTNFVIGVSEFYFWASTLHL